jgi:hypothetical protein
MNPLSVVSVRPLEIVTFNFCFCLPFYPAINDFLLEALKPAEMDCTMRTGCLGDTRADVLTKIVDWAYEPASTQRILWLHGPAGSGKSTISTTVVERFRQSKQLGAFLFFDRDNTERGNPALVPRNLAHQICLSYPEIGAFIISAIENNAHTLASQISSQFQELIINPLSSISTYSQIVLVLDGLDECGTRADRKALLDTLAEESVFLPPTCRLIITSRPDIDMRLAFEFQAHVKPLELDLTSAATQRDILTYIRHQMKSINKKNRYWGPLGWPGLQKVKALARRACGLFVWASIVCNFIDAHDPGKRLDIILKGNQAPTADAALDSLYQTALKVLGMWDDADFVEDFRSIISIMLVLRNPLNTIAIDNLLNHPDGRPSAHTVEKLRCVICSNPTVRFIHPSVADFLMDKSRGGNEIWFFTPAFCERNIATLCLRRLTEVLHRDMSRFALLLDREDETTPKDVVYACVFWIDHVCMVEDDLSSIDQLLKTFIDQHILHWFEAMSLLRRFSLAITLLGQLFDWIQSHRHLSNLQQHVRHWWRFSEEYEECIRERPMQVYSEVLHQKFPLTQVQEPLISQLPAPSIFELFTHTQAPSEVSSVEFPSSSISQKASLLDSDSCLPILPVSRSASPTRISRPVSLSSFNQPRNRSSSASSMIHKVSPPVSDSCVPIYSILRSPSPTGDGRPISQSAFNQSRNRSSSASSMIHKVSLPVPDSCISIYPPFRSPSPIRVSRPISRSSLNKSRNRSSSASSMTPRRLSRSSLDIQRHRSSSVSSLIQQESPSDAFFSRSRAHSSSRRSSFGSMSESPLNTSAAPTQGRRQSFGSMSESPLNTGAPTTQDRAAAACVRGINADSEKPHKTQQLPLAPTTTTPHTSTVDSVMVQQEFPSDAPSTRSRLHSLLRRRSFGRMSGSPLNAGAATTQGRAAAARERGIDTDSEKPRNTQQLPFAPRITTPHTGMVDSVMMQQEFPHDVSSTRSRVHSSSRRHSFSSTYRSPLNITAANSVFWP